MVSREIQHGRRVAVVPVRAEDDGLTRPPVLDEGAARLAMELAEAQRVGGVGSWVLRSAGGADWSDEMCRIHGLAPSTPIRDDMDWYVRFMDPESFAVLTARVGTVLRDGGSYELEYDVRRADGSVRHVLSRGSAIVGPAGTVEGVRGTTIDLTELVETRLELAARELELAEAQRAAKVGSWMTRSDGTNVWSDEMCRIHGLEPGEPVPDLDAYLQRFQPGAGVTVARERMADTMRTGVAYEAEYTVVRPDGEALTLLARGSAVRDACGAIVGLRGSCVDITDRARTRQALAASERLHRALVGSLAEAVIVQDLTGRIVVANAAASHILGIRLDALTGLTSVDDRWEGAHEDGSPYPGEEHPAMVTLRTGLPVRDAVMQVARPGRGRVWLHINSTPLTDEDGSLTGVVVSFEDITDFMQAQEAQRRFGAELEQRVAERTAELALANEELQVVSATISHDLRSPVRAVAGFARLLQLRHAAELSPEAAHYVDNIVVSGETMGRLIDDFLAYVRLGQDHLRREPIDLTAEVAWLRLTFGQRLEATGGTLRTADPLAAPMGDPAMVRRMLQNLVDNAIAYARPDVPPVVTIAAQRTDAGVSIAVSDNGRGIDPAAMEHIFDVFTRLQPDQDLAHAGIGLAMVRKAAHSMGSEVSVDSEVGVGSTFRFTLPAAPEPPAA